MKINNMPEFYIIIARKIFSRILGNTCPPDPLSPTAMARGMRPPDGDNEVKKNDDECKSLNGCRSFFSSRIIDVIEQHLPILEELKMPCLKSGIASQAVARTSSRRGVAERIGRAVAAYCTPARSINDTRAEGGRREDGRALS